MAVKFRGIHPVVAIEKEYHRDLLRYYLYPYMDGLSAELGKLGEAASTDDWLRVMAVYSDRWQSHNTLTTDFLAIDSEPAGMGSLGGKMDDLFAEMDEAIESLEEENIPEDALPEDVIELLKKKWDELRNKENLKRVGKRLFSEANPLQGDLKKKVDDALDNYLNIILFRAAKFYRIGREVHGIVFKGGEGTRTAARLREHLWDLRTNLALWIGGIKKIRGYMSPDGVVRLMGEIAEYYAPYIQESWDRMLGEFAKATKARAERMVENFTIFRVAKWTAQTAQDLLEHLKKVAQSLRRFSQIANRMYLYTQPGGPLRLFEDLLSQYSKKLFDQWVQVKKYIDFESMEIDLDLIYKDRLQRFGKYVDVKNREIDLDLIYKDYMKPYLDRVDESWSRWERRLRFIDFDNKEIDLDLLLPELYQIFLNSAWAKWGEAAQQAAALGHRWHQGGIVRVLDDIIDFALAQLEEQAVSLAQRKIRQPAERAVLKWLDKTTRAAHTAFARDFIRVAKVDIRPALRSARLNGVLRESARENIALIKTIPQRFHDDLTRKLIAGEEKAPLDLQARAKMFRRVGKSSGYNLRRITRDQSNKLVGKINRANQQALGINVYRWETSDDDRVRPSHRSKDGLIFSWDDPPPDTGHPGEDIQCRCIALPVVSLASLQARHERITKKRERRKERETAEYRDPDAPQDDQVLPYIAEVGEEDAKEAEKSGDYNIVPVPGKEGRFHLVPKEQALSTIRVEPDDDDDVDYGLSEEDISNEDVPTYNEDDQDLTLEQIELDYLQEMRESLENEVLAEWSEGDYDYNEIMEEADRRLERWRDTSEMTEQEIDRHIEAGWRFGDRAVAQVLARFGAKRVEEARIRAGQRPKSEAQIEEDRRRAAHRASQAETDPTLGMGAGEIGFIEATLEYNEPGDDEWTHMTSKYSTDIIEAVRRKMDSKQ